MKQIIFTFGEKILYGLGFGLGLGISMKILNGKNKEKSHVYPRQSPAQ